MKKILSGLCALSLALSFTSVFAGGGDKEYTAEGGYFTENQYGVPVYINTDGTRYEYHLREDGDTVALFYVNSTTGDVTVPETVNGLKVVSISGYDGNTGTLENLVIPDTVTEMDNFGRYEALKTVKLSNSLTKLEHHLFKNCTALESIEIPASVAKIEKEAFAGCTSLHSVVFNEGLLSIDPAAFSSCPIESMRLPSTLINIGRLCFDNNKALKTIVIPENVKRIEIRAFNRNAIETVEFKGKVEFMDYGAFSGDNLNEVIGLSKDDMIRFWTSFDHTPWQEKMKNDDEPFLVDKNGRLVAYIGSKTDIELPDSVKTIGSMAFGSKPITSIVIPNSVATIEERAFYQCEELRSVTIPASVTKIGQMAFQNCYRLKNITFEYSDVALNLGSSAFAFTLASPKTVVTNNRRYSNQKTAFENTYFDEDYVPVSKNGVSYDDEYVEPTESPKPTETMKPTESPRSTAEPIEKETASPEPDSSSEDTASAEVLTVAQRGEGVSVSVNGADICFEDAQPFIDENERTQIPIRAVAEALGAMVDWNDASQTAVITKGKKKVIIGIGNVNMQTNNRIVTMDTAAQIINDRTYIPVRFVGEALGMKVNWEGE